MKDRDQKERRSNGGMLTATNKIRYSLRDIVKITREIDDQLDTIIQIYREHFKLSRPLYSPDDEYLA